MTTTLKSRGYMGLKKGRASAMSSKEKINYGLEQARKKKD
jgi:hypothetical protein